MPDYSKGKIYKIVDNTNEKVYIGSTCEPTLAKRLAKHVGNYNSYLRGHGNFATSYKIIQNGNYNIILLENCPCETKDELHARERHYIETIECVNKIIPTRSKKEYNLDNQDKFKQYYKEYRIKYESNNKEKISQNKKKYYQEKKEIKNEKFTCECGGKYTNSHTSRHLKTSKHQNYIRLKTLKDCLINNLSFE